MPSHLSCIGLPVNDQAEFAALADRVGPLATPIETERGTYWRWSSPCGAELWLQTNNDHVLVGITPYFAGIATIQVRLTAHVAREHDSDLDGAVRGWADPSSTEPDSGAYPFVFDLVDSARHADLTFPSVVTAHIAAFAHEVKIYPSLDAYNADDSGEMKFASQSFIPSGLFEAAESKQPPQSHAIFTGHVLAAALKTNSLTGERYYWAHVDTLGGSFDVVIDPAICDRPPEIGAVLTGSFWLCGRLLDT